MKVYSFGAENAPVILLLPGTCCHWKDNFGHVVPLLQDTFRVLCVSGKQPRCGRLDAGSVLRADCRGAPVNGSACRSAVRSLSACAPRRAAM